MNANLPSLMIGTTNRTKSDRIRRSLEGCSVNLFIPDDIGGLPVPDESGSNPGDISRAKAVAYCRAAAMPTVAIDSALYINGLPESKQPSVFVRRLHGKTNTDEELLRAFVALLKDHGGDSPGYWLTGISVAMSPNDVRTTVQKSARLFRTKPCLARTPDEPLNSVAFLPQFGRYYAELSANELEVLHSGFSESLLKLVRAAFDLPSSGPAAMCC